jgi:hypothetical protein
MMSRINPEVVKAQIASLLVEFPELAEDEEALALSLDSETEAVELLSDLVVRIGNAKAMGTGLAAYISELRDRADTIDRRIEAQRALAQKIMETADLKKAGTPRVVVTDEAALPKDCVRMKTEPDKITIKRKLDQGATVTGAVLSNAGPVLQIRVR